MQIHNKTAKIGQNRPTFCVLCAKKGTGLKKKYTTAGYGGCDKYQVRACVLCNSHQKKRGCHSHFLCQGYKTVSPHLPWNVWGTGNPFRLGATALTFKWRWRSPYSGGGLLMWSASWWFLYGGIKLVEEGGWGADRMDVQGGAELRPLSSYSSLQLWRNYPQAQLGPLLVGDHGNFK